jgi:hypothetical protein
MPEDFSFNPLGDVSVYDFLGTVLFGVGEWVGTIYPLLVLVAIPVGFVIIGTVITKIKKAVR